MGTELLMPAHDGATRVGAAVRVMHAECFFNARQVRALSGAELPTPSRACLPPGGVLRRVSALTAGARAAAAALLGLAADAPRRAAARARRHRRGRADGSRRGGAAARAGGERELSQGRGAGGQLEPGAEHAVARHARAPRVRGLDPRTAPQSACLLRCSRGVGARCARQERTRIDPLMQRPVDQSSTKKLVMQQACGAVLPPPVAEAATRPLDWLVPAEAAWPVNCDAQPEICAVVKEVAVVRRLSPRLELREPAVAPPRVRTATSRHTRRRHRGRRRGAGARRDGGRLELEHPRDAWPVCRRRQEGADPELRRRRSRCADHPGL